MKSSYRLSEALKDELREISRPPRPQPASMMFVSFNWTPQEATMPVIFRAPDFLIHERGDLPLICPDCHEMFIVKSPGSREVFCPFCGTAVKETSI